MPLRNNYTAYCRFRSLLSEFTKAMCSAVSSPAPASGPNYEHANNRMTFTADIWALEKRPLRSLIDSGWVMVLRARKVLLLCHHGCAEEKTETRLVITNNFALVDRRNSHHRYQDTVLKQCNSGPNYDQTSKTHQSKRCRKQQTQLGSGSRRQLVYLGSKVSPIKSHQNLDVTAHTREIETELCGTYVLLYFESLVCTSSCRSEHYNEPPLILSCT